MLDSRFISRLQEQLTQPLPGREAQYRMAHVGRQHAPDPPADAKQAGVLALFYPAAGHMHLVLIERVSHHLRDRHRGQIGFPGGRYEEQDAHLGDTALRETEEEVGVPAGDIRLLGKLTDLYIPVSNFQVHPFIGYLEYTPRFVPEPSEVKSVLEVPFRHLQDPTTHGRTDIRISTHITLRQVPCFRVAEKIVWGATAMILSELLEVSGALAPHQD